MNYRIALYAVVLVLLLGLTSLQAWQQQSLTTLLRLEDYWVAKMFDGKPTTVNPAGHPDAKHISTRLTEEPGHDTRSAGHHARCGSPRFVWPTVELPQR